MTNLSALNQQKSGFVTKFSDFGKCEPTKNSWILFSEIWPASGTKILDPIFFWIYPKKIQDSKFLDFSRKKSDMRFSFGRYKPWYLDPQ